MTEKATETFDVAEGQLLIHTITAQQSHCGCPTHLSNGPVYVRAVDEVIGRNLLLFKAVIMPFGHYHKQYPTARVWGN